MKEYIKPELKIEIVEVEDVIAASGPNTYDPQNILSGNADYSWFA